MILGAVARELFPQIGNERTPSNFLGITFGTIAALLVVNFTDPAVEYLQEKVLTICCSFSLQRKDSVDGEHQPLANITSSPSLSDSPQHQPSDHQSDEHASSMSAGEAEQNVLLLSTQAVASPRHRGAVREHVVEILTLIESMQSKSNQLHLRYQPSYDSVETQQIQLRDAEYLADELDSDIHRLQYQLDRCRRLLQGSGSDFAGIVPRLRVTEGSKERLRQTLSFLHFTANSVLEELTKTAPLTSNDLSEMHIALARLDDELTYIHGTVEGYNYRWGGTRRQRRAITTIPTDSKHIPLSLITAVIVDCIVDGFLLGTTSSFSLRAGVILSLANCLEMGFLGFSLSVRLQKCTASTVFARYCCLIVPPLIMFGAAILGVFVAGNAKANSMFFVAFISFGIVALVNLVVNELLAEARETIQGRETWWSAMVLFIGIYCVLCLDLIIPTADDGRSN